MLVGFLERKNITQVLPDELRKLCLYYKGVRSVSLRCWERLAAQILLSGVLAEQQLLVVYFFVVLEGKK